tara:strand:+ start:174 stop:383 length:210 start_codon:yes stop_codon:yes gene_type:complete
MGAALRSSIQFKVSVLTVCVILSAIICFHYYIRQHIHQILNRRDVPVTRGVIVRNLPNNAIIITIEEKT